MRSPAKKRKVEPRAREPTAESEGVQEDEEVVSQLLSSPGKRRALSEAVESDGEQEQEFEQEDEDEDEEIEEVEEPADTGKDKGKAAASRPPLSSASQASQVSLSDVKRSKKRSRR